MGVEILTLGNFDIQIDRISVLPKSSRASKNLELLKYLVTHKNKHLLPDTIVEELWLDADEVIDLKNALRTQIHRLKRSMVKIGLMGDDSQPNGMGLTFENGFYIFSPGLNCIIDTDSFENNIKLADSIKDKESNLAIEKYSAAIGLYQGQYLTGGLGGEWIYPLRSRYHRLYVRAVLNLAELLKTEKRFTDIIELYDTAVINAPYDEGLHLYYLEALLALNQIRNALSHYNFITAKMQREFSVGPTPALKNIYRKIAADHPDSHIGDLMFLSRYMAADDKMEGALCCGIDDFVTIYNYERRKSSRTGQTGFIGLISVLANEAHISKGDRERVIENLELHLTTRLRKGDVFCRRSLSQILLLLPNMAEVNLQLLEKRIHKTFKNTAFQGRFTLKIDFQPITALDPFESWESSQVGKSSWDGS